MISADILRRLAALKLPADAMGEVLSIIADMSSVEEARKRRDRDRKIQGKSKEIPRQIQETTTEQDVPLTKESNNKILKKERGSRISTTWVLMPDDRKFALDRGLQDSRLTIETEKFRNYWTAKSGSAAIKLDWSATWRNWVLSALERAGITAPAPPPDPNLPPMHLRPPWMLEGITEAEWEARRMEMIKGLKNGHDKKPEVRGNTAVGQGGHNDAPKLRFEG